MGLPAFDTHAYVKRLKAVGFNEAQAEAQAELQSDILSSLVTEKLATKEDVAQLGRDIAHSRQETKENIANLRQELKDDFTRLENETKRDIVHLAGKIGQLNWMLGFLLAGVAAIVFKLFLHT
jgi:hypothetical protein